MTALVVSIISSMLGLFFCTSLALSQDAYTVVGFEIAESTRLRLEFYVGDRTWCADEVSVTAIGPIPSEKSREMVEYRSAISSLQNRMTTECHDMTQLRITQNGATIDFLAAPSKWRVIRIQEPTEKEVCALSPKKNLCRKAINEFMRLNFIFRSDIFDDVEQIDEPNKQNPMHIKWRTKSGVIGTIMLMKHGDTSPFDENTYSLASLIISPFAQKCLDNGNAPNIEVRNNEIATSWISAKCKTTAGVVLETFHVNVTDESPDYAVFSFYERGNEGKNVDEFARKFKEY